MQNANLECIARWEAALKLNRCPRAQVCQTPRAQPRDGRNRFLSWAWLAQAETFTDADMAWFQRRAL